MRRLVLPDQWTTENVDQHRENRLGAPVTTDCLRGASLGTESDLNLFRPGLRSRAWDATFFDIIPWQEASPVEEEDKDDKKH